MVLRRLVFEDKAIQETLIRKTRLLRKIGPMAMRSSVTSKIVLSRTILRRLATNDLEIASLKARAASMRCFPRSRTRIDLLFTMSEITHATSSRSNACETVFASRTIVVALVAIGHCPSSPSATPGTTLRLRLVWLRHA
jgi:hypothetical protein